METGTDETLDTLPTDSRDGNYRFDGWFTDPTGGVQITTSTVFTEETTVYAHWVTLTDLQMMIISLVAILPAIPAIVLTWT